MKMHQVWSSYNENELHLCYNEYFQPLVETYKLVEIVKNVFITCVTALVPYWYNVKRL